MSAHLIGFRYDSNASKRLGKFARRPEIDLCDKNPKTPIAERSGNAAQGWPHRQTRTPPTSPGWPAHFPSHEIKGGCPSNQRSAILLSSDEFL